MTVTSSTHRPWRNHQWWCGPLNQLPSELPCIYLLPRCVEHVFCWHWRGLVIILMMLVNSPKKRVNKSHGSWNHFLCETSLRLEKLKKNPEFESEISSFLKNVWYIYNIIYIYIIYTYIYISLIQKLNLTLLVLNLALEKRTGLNTITWPFWSRKNNCVPIPKLQGFSSSRPSKCAPRRFFSRAAPAAPNPKVDSHHCRLGGLHTFRLGNVSQSRRETHT